MKLQQPRWCGWQRASRVPALAGSSRPAWCAPHNAPARCVGTTCVSAASTNSTSSSRGLTAAALCYYQQQHHQHPTAPLLVHPHRHLRSTSRSRFSFTRARGGVKTPAVAAAAQQQQQQAHQPPLPVLPTWLSPSAEKHRFLSAARSTIYAAVQPTEAGYTAIISIPGETLPRGFVPKLHWGMYRCNPTWVHPPEVIPPESWRDESSGAMRSHFHFDESRDLWSVELKIPRHMAPVTLGFVLWNAEANEFDGSRAGRHFALPIGHGAGKPYPLGPTLVSTTAARSNNAADVRCTLNFAVFSRHATSMTLCLMRADGASYLEVALDPSTNKTGDVWHIQLSRLKDVGSLVYGWRPNGPGSWAEGGRFHPAYIMLDPYCPRVVPVTLPQAAYESAPLLPPEGSVKGPCLLGSLSYLTDEFDWGGVERPQHTLEETVIVELDVAGFTTGPDAEAVVPPELRNTYLGVVARMADIQASGATAVLLGNVFMSSTLPPPAAANGSSWPEVRRPLNFFAPDTRFVAGGNPADAAYQLKSLIKALHAAGVEVLLEAEFCMTSEAGGGIGGRLQSYAGLDGDIYLRGGGGPEATGVLNTGQPVVRQLLLDALRWWVTEYQVDGFCFVNAENMTQDTFGGVMDSPSIVEDLASEPLFAACKLIAASANDALLPRSGVRGFPHYGALMEWNNRFGADMLALLRDNTPGMLSAFATRMMGSQDVFAARWDGGLPGGLATGRRPAFGVNALEPPLAGDLLSVAGEGSDPGRAEIVARSLLLAMLVAQGTPVFNAPTLSARGLLHFAQGVLVLRKRYRSMLSPPLFNSPRAISWHGPSPLIEPDWSGAAAAALTPGSNYVAFMVRGDKQQAVYVGFNPNPEPCAVSLPNPGLRMQWRRLVDTARAPPLDVALENGELLESEYIVASGAAIMLDAVPRPAGSMPTPQAAAAVQKASSVYQRMTAAGTPY